MKDISRDVIGAAIEVHKELGPGLLEKCYERALKYELELRGHKVVTQGYVPVMYKGIDVTGGDATERPLRYDLLVDDSLVVEIKSVDSFSPVHFKQLSTYLKLLDKHVGLLFNFNVSYLMEDGFKRIVYRFEDND